MATLKGSTIAGTYDQLVQRAASYAQTGTNIELMDDTSNAVAQPTGLYLESGATTDNVGIGVAAPDTLLHVKVSSGIAELKIESDDNDAKLYFDTGANTKASYIVFQDEGVDENRIASYNEGYGNVSMQSSLAFYTDAATDGFSATSPKMMIDKDGIVGIGTDSPRCLLEGKIAARTTTYAAETASTWADITLWNPTNTINTATGIRFALGTDDPDDSTDSGVGIAGVKQHATSEHTELAFIVDASGNMAEAMRIDLDGNVGIGTSSPDTKLHLSETSMSDEESNIIYIQGTGTSATRYSSFGIRYNSDAASSGGTDAPVSYMRLDSSDAIIHYMWFDDSDALHWSPTITHLGTTSGTAVFDQTSDERLKNISSDAFPYGLSEINNLIPIKYSMKSDTNNKQKLGFGGQTTKSIIPEAVHDTGECIDGYTATIDGDSKEVEEVANSTGKDTKLTMSYIQIVPVLVKAIQELSAKVIALENA